MKRPSRRANARRRGLSLFMESGNRDPPRIWRSSVRFAIRKSALFIRSAESDAGDRREAATSRDRRLAVVVSRRPDGRRVECNSTIPGAALNALWPAVRTSPGNDPARRGWADSERPAEGGVATRYVRCRPTPSGYRGGRGRVHPRSLLVLAIIPATASVIGGTLMLVCRHKIVIFASLGSRRREWAPRQLGRRIVSGLLSGHVGRFERR
jgi:hypothetical protein